MAFNLEKNSCLITSLVGEELINISNSQYFFNGVACSEDIGAVELVFLSGKTICLNLQNDGESINVSNGELEITSEFKISKEETASWKKLSIDKASSFLGRSVTSISQMIDHYTEQKTDVISGLKVSFNDSTYFVYYNCGDEAKLLVNELPLTSKGIKTRWK